MYCPKCSQQQVSDDTSFCSRCGFQLNAVKSLLTGNETSLTQNAAAGALGSSLRKKDMIIGALLMFLMAVRVAWVTEDLSLEGKITGLIINCIILLALIYITPIIRDFFRRRATQDSPSSPEIPAGFFSKFKKKDQTAALPPAYSIPANDYVTGRIKTAEPVSPPSVTEKTTNLLRNNQN
jgi:hypothetical protein